MTGKRMAAALAVALGITGVNAASPIPQVCTSV